MGNITQKIHDFINRTKFEKQDQVRRAKEKAKAKEAARKNYRLKQLEAQSDAVFTQEELDPAYLAGLEKAPEEVVKKSGNKIRLVSKAGNQKKNKGEKLVRIHKVLAQAGVASTRKSEQLIQERRVSVNGEIATIGQQVNINDLSLVIRVDGQVVKFRQALNQPCQVLFYNKAEGEISTRHDPEGRVTVFDRLPRLSVGRWVQVGRLDVNTSGLLLFTNDGDLAHRLMHPSYNIERKYICRVYGTVTDEALRQLEKGVMLEDGLAKFNSIRRLNHVDPENPRKKSNDWFEVSLSEGRNHEVRRLWETQDLVVSRLIRTEYAGICLDSKVMTIPVSGYLEADLNEINMLRGLVGLRPETEGFRPGNYGQSKSELKRQKNKQLRDIRNAIRKDKSHRKPQERVYDEKTKDKRDRRKQLVEKISQSNRELYASEKKSSKKSSSVSSFIDHFGKRK